MYQTGQTIKETLNKIQHNNLVLPAIQREFVWKPEQICRLFDSLMQGYPFGTFLYWRVEPENSDKFNFYGFVLDYHELKNRHCPRLSSMPNQQLTAVLDGQQRLTALNIGLRGSMAWKLPNRWWNNPHAFPGRRLYLDLLWQPDENNEEGLKNDFSFLTSEEYENSQSGKCWFPVSKILSMERPYQVSDWVIFRNLEQKQSRQANKKLHDLHNIIHNKLLVVHYRETGQELDKVLQIFIRMNDGGTLLSHSDMLLSIAVAQWKEHNAREEIHALVDELNSIGTRFTFSKDLVLKAGLMLSDIGSVGFKVDNFNRENMDVFEDNWNDIKRALTLTVQLVSSFGFSGQNLSAHNAILPIAYYLYLKDPGDAYLRHRCFEEDRREIREWLIRSLLKSGVWGSGLDTLLTALRQVIRENGSDAFPVGSIYKEMERRGRSLVFEGEELEDLADMQYGNRLTFALLSLLFPFVELRNHFHVDHVFPKKRLSVPSLKAAGVSEDKTNDFVECRDRLANLQLLPGVENNEKRARMPAEWLCERFSDSVERRRYTEDHLLGEVPKEMVDFDDFYKARRERLKKKIGELLGR